MASTMNDVAKLAGVSPATVSRVLSKSPYISEKTVKKVLVAVKALRYHRNIHARRLAIGKSDLFGLIISEIANPFFAEIIRGFQSVAWDRGFDVLLLNTEYNKTRTELIIKKLLESDVRGVAVMTSSVDESVIPALAETGICSVFCSAIRPSHLVSNIVIDYKRGLIDAIEHVASLGHHRAAVIAGPEKNRTAAAVKKALIRGLKHRGFDPDPVTHSDYHLDAGASAVKVILAARNIPTVIFCGSDLIAMGAMAALEAAGVAVPRDISVVGIDDIPFAFLARPPLTTISVPREQLGILAFQALEKMLSPERRKGHRYALDTKLVVRGSTARARSATLRGIGFPQAEQ